TTRDLLYDRIPNHDMEPDTRLKSEFKIAITGQEWIVRVHAMPQFTAGFEFKAPKYFAAFGTAFSLLLFGMVRSNNKRRNIAETASQRNRFLAEANAAFSSSLDYHATLTRVAALAVPRFADWCVVALLDERGGTSCLTTVHMDPENADALRAK